MLDVLSHPVRALPRLEPHQYATVSQPLLRVARVSSWQALRDSSAFCKLHARSGSVRVQPTRNGGGIGPDGGYYPQDDETTTVNVTDSAATVGQVVLDALRRCRKRVD